MFFNQSETRGKEKKNKKNTIKPCREHKKEQGENNKHMWHKNTDLQVYVILQVKLYIKWESH